MVNSDRHFGDVYCVCICPAIISGSQSNLRSAARERIRSSVVPRNDRNVKSNIHLFTDDCIIYRKIMDSSDIEKLQMDLNRLGKWAVQNEMKINPGNSKAIIFTKARVKE